MIEEKSQPESKEISLFLLEKFTPEVKETACLLCSLWNGDKDAAIKTFKSIRSLECDKGGFTEDELNSILLYAFNNGARDFIVEIDRTSFIYNDMIETAAFFKDMELIKRLMDDQEIAKRCGSEFALRAIIKGLQRGHHYGVGPLMSLEEIISGTPEIIGNNTDRYRNVYYMAIKGIIEYESPEIWDKINKQHWDPQKYNHLYYYACIRKNLHVVESIEKLNMLTMVKFKILKCWEFNLIENVQQLVDDVMKLEDEDKEEDFVSYWWSIIARDSDSDKFLDFFHLFVDNFGLDHPSVDTRDYYVRKAQYPDASYHIVDERKCLFCAIGRGIDPNTIVTYSSTFQRFIYGVDDIEFLICHGLTDIDPIRKKLPIFFTDENLFIMAMCFKSYSASNKFLDKFTDSESKIIQHYLDVHINLLRQCLLPDVVINLIL